MAGLLGLALLAPAGAQAQQVRPLRGIPVPQIHSGPQGITIVPMPGVLPAIRVPLAPPRTAPRAPAPPPVAAPVAPPVAAPPLAAPAPLAPAVPPAAAPSAAPGVGLTPGQVPGRIVGVFVGISDYPNGNDLPYTASDAIRVQQAFVNAGVIAPMDTVVLTDRQATRAAVGGAVERMSRRLGANDTLVFFFSGHGNHVRDDNGDERDGLDETIILADGPVTDDELFTLLGEGPGRDVVALDSCYSGGFQQDLARLPDSVGFYASAEDQLSYVASEHQAGGYLSYYLAESVRQSRGRPLEMWQVQRDLSEGYARSQANGRQDLTVGLSRSTNTHSVLFGAASDAPAQLAAR